MTSETTWFSEVLVQYGPLGVFIVSLIGNAIPYSTIPYLLFIIVYAGTISDATQLLLITILGGLGAAIGKLIIYYFGVGIRRMLPEEMKKNMEAFVEISKNSIFLAVFLFAALPLPDDILYVPVGAMKYSVKKFFTALLAGKIIITGVSVFFGSSFSYIFSGVTKTPVYISIPVLVAITLLLTYIVAEINWFQVVEVSREKGFLATTIYIIKCSIEALLRLPDKIKRKIKERK